jgi:hypothetical protein
VKVFFLTAIVLVGLQSQAAIEVYKGQSEFGDEETGKSCVVTLERDEKSNEILALKVAAPARLYRRTTSTTMDNVHVEAAEGREGFDTALPKHFSEFKFQKLADIQGEGYMLRGEKVLKSKKDEKVFIHFDIRDGAIAGIEFAEHESRASMNNPSSKLKNPSDRVYIEKVCSGLKKSDLTVR